MKLSAESKFEIGEWVKVGKIIVKVQEIEYWPQKGFSYRVNEGSDYRDYIRWHDEKYLSFVAVTEIPKETP